MKARRLAKGFESVAGARFTVGALFLYMEAICKSACI